jgi:hypothetical protein
MSNLTIYEDGYYAQDPIKGGGASNVTVGGGTQVPDAPRGTSQVSNIIPENPSVISEPRPRETYEPLGLEPKEPKGAGASVITEPDLGTSSPKPSPDLGTPIPKPLPILPILSGGGGGGGAMGGGAGSGSADELIDKKPFPYWILIAGLVGGYLVFKK